MAEQTSFDIERKRLWDELVLLQNTSDEYNYLFAESQERIDLLNRTARWFFGLSQRTLMREIILGISRVTDSAGAAAKRNLTLDHLLSDPKLQKEPELRAELQNRISELREAAEPIRKHRHKYIAHLDHAVAVNRAQNPLPKLPRSLVDEVLKEMQSIYNRHGGHLYDSHAYFEVATMGGAKALVRVLEIGDRWRLEDARVAREKLLSERGYSTDG